LFQPCPDAVYGFPDARLVERVESRHQTIEIWDTPRLGALFTLDGRPMTSAGDEFIYHECMVHPAAASIRCVITNQPCTRGYSRQRDRCAIN
jgi:spermidine synthase